MHLKRSRLRMVVLGVVLAVAGVVGWPLWPEDLFWPELRVATEAPPASVRVGPNVHVSKPHEQFPFDECVVAADPSRPGRLFAASMYWPHGDGQSLVGYLSDDGGATWTPSLNLVADRAVKERLNDPTAAFGPDGQLHFVHMRYDRARQEESGRVWVGVEGAGWLDWLRLPPGGTTDWEVMGRIHRAIDRPWLAVDCTAGPHRGNLYCAANVGAPLWITSADGGETFHTPPLSHPDRLNPYPTQPVVLRDGTAVAAFRCVKHRQLYDTKLRYHVFTSADGGRTAVRSAPVASGWKHPRDTSREGTVAGTAESPQLAVDPGSERFADRLYCVWSELFGKRRESQRVMLSRSLDRGGSWTDPVILSENDLGPLAPDYHAFMPCVAVNKGGVVAVTWYDRRGLSPQPPAPARAIGWNVRMRASLDGGETWAPSVPVNSCPAVGLIEVGHTAGLAADAGGRFHPVWIDDRTGRGQLWTAAVEVSP